MLQLWEVTSSETLLLTKRKHSHLLPVLLKSLYAHNFKKNRKLRNSKVFSKTLHSQCGKKENMDSKVWKRAAINTNYHPLLKKSFIRASPDRLLSHTSAGFFLFKALNYQDLNQDGSKPKPTSHWPDFSLNLWQGKQLYTEINLFHLHCYRHNRKLCVMSPKDQDLIYGPQC